MLPRRRPRRTRRTRRPRRRTQRRRVRLTRNVNVRPFTRQLFPRRVSTKMIWSEVTDVVTAVNTPYTIVYSINGMNDPNITVGSTHKPMGFNQMNPLYINYVVTGVKVIFEGSHTAAGGHQLSLQAGTNGLTFFTAPSAINEYRQAYSIMTSNQRPWRFSKYFSIASVLGVPRSTMLVDENYWGQTAGSTNPPYGASMQFQIANIDSSEQINSQFTVTFVYYVTFFNNQVTSQS